MPATFMVACRHIWCVPSLLPLTIYKKLPPFPSLQMPVTAKHWKVQTNTMKDYQRPQQYIYQLGHVAPGLGLLVSVCILMLPILGLVDEHAQLTTTDYTSPIHQCYIHLCHGHITSCHTSLVLPSLNNVIPAMVLQNTLVRMSVRCPLYTCVHHVSPIDILSGLGRRVVGIVLVLLLLLSGDIETNPGPVGEFLY